MINDDLRIYNNIDKGLDVLGQHMRGGCVYFTHLMKKKFTYKIRIFKF